MMTTLRRRLRPLKPILGPPWNLFRTVVGDEHRFSIPNLVRRAALGWRVTVRTIRRRPEPPIRALDAIELVDLVAAEPYYRARRRYLGVGAAIASDLIERRGLTTALELGPHLRSLIVGGDVMDVRISDQLQGTGRRIAHDATKVPWPIADKAYDLFLAFQVFEHLGNHQPEAFREVRRVARHAILSLPIDWEMADPTNCHHRVSEERVLGWFAPVVPTRVVVGNPGHRKRLLFVFEDLPAPEPDTGIQTA
jgi:hypothetical protein